MSSLTMNRSRGKCKSKMETNSLDECPCGGPIGWIKKRTRMWDTVSTTTQNIYLESGSQGVYQYKQEHSVVWRWRKSRGAKRQLLSGRYQCDWLWHLFRSSLGIKNTNSISNEVTSSASVSEEQSSDAWGVWHVFRVFECWLRRPGSERFFGHGRRTGAFYACICLWKREKPGQLHTGFEKSDQWPSPNGGRMRDINVMCQEGFLDIQDIAAALPQLEYLNLDHTGTHRRGSLEVMSSLNGPAITPAAGYAASCL